MTASTYALRTAHVGQEGGESIPVVKVTGEIDITNAADFGKEVAALPGPRPLVLDLSNVLYLDSAGFAVLDRLISERTAYLVIAPGSRTHTAAILLGMPHHACIDAAMADAENRP
ncbi:STAS domain-containing protein [Streptomyces sp. NPDC055239]